MSTNDTEFDLSNSLAFDKDKQAAVFAWCLYDDKFCEACSRLVKSDWFSSPYIRLLYDAFMALYESEGRRVTPNELLKFHDFSRKEKGDQDSLKSALEHAVRQTEHYKAGLLRKEMTSWMKAALFYQMFEKASRAYNNHNVKEAWDIVDDAALINATATFEDGVNMGFASSVERMAEEEAERDEDAKKLLNFGISFLDDALGGILPTDLSIWGAKTGHGKTQAVTCVSKAVTQAGFPVHYFALEGENNEIERRLKYGILSDTYFRRLARDPGRPRVDISYTDWRMGKLKKVLDVMAREEEVAHAINESVRNLYTLYRNSGNFDMKALEKNIMKIIDKTRFIVIDHLNYIDTDARTENENRAYKQIIKLIRDVVLRHRVPVALVAHLRKTNGHGANNLIACIDDFMGSSDVPKISTTAIMISRARDVPPPEAAPWSRPTFMAIEKCRLEGARTQYTGMTYFNTRLGVYEDFYRVGEMDPGRTEWTEAAKIPAWAKRADHGNRL